MSELIRVDKLVDNKNIVVGNKMANLVLETLGKIYIKYGRNTVLLNDLFTLLENTDTEDLSKVIIVSSLSELDSLLNSTNYPGDGYFIYNTTSNILYITYNSEAIPLIDATDYKKDLYVKRSGDYMSGLLEMTTSKAPFIVNSLEQVKNLNSSYLEGNNSKVFAKKYEDELIPGSWTFNGNNIANGPWTFNLNIRAYKDFVTTGNIVSPSFLSGYNGHGFMLDSSTNTFTIDYLIVRKAMLVYELVINKISATNGSLWITNSSKIDTITEIKSINTTYKLSLYITGDDLISDKSWIYYLDGNIIYLLNILDLALLISKYSDNTLLEIFTDISTNGSSYARYYKVDITDITQETMLTISNISDFITNGITASNCLNVNLYSQYFTVNSNYYVITTSGSEYPTFKLGDLIRCLKYTDGNIKYYDAVVLRILINKTVLIQLVNSVFDKYTNVEYSENGLKTYSSDDYNNNLYKKTETSTNNSGVVENIYSENVRLDVPQSGDDLVQIGSICDLTRQGSIYLTSTDDRGPYIDILLGVNRPDFSVVKYIPNYVMYNGYYLYKAADAEIVVGEKSSTFTISDTNEVTYSDSGTLLYLLTKPVLSNKMLVYRDVSTSNTSSNVYSYKYLSLTTTKVRLGNLDGIYNLDWGDKQPYGFGLYGLNVFLTGEFYLNNGKSVVDFSLDGILLKFKNSGLYINGNGIVIDSDKVQIQNNGNTVALFLDGYITASLIKVDDLEAHKVICTRDFSTYNDLTSKFVTVTAPTATININGNGEHLLYYEPVLSTTTSGKKITSHNNYYTTTIDLYNYLSQVMKEDILIIDSSGKYIGVQTIYYDRDGNIINIENKYIVNTTNNYNSRLLVDYLDSSTVDENTITIDNKSITTGTFSSTSVTTSTILYNNPFITFLLCNKLDSPKGMYSKTLVSNNFYTTTSLPISKTLYSTGNLLDNVIPLNINNSDSNELLVYKDTVPTKADVGIYLDNGIVLDTYSGTTAIRTIGLNYYYVINKSTTETVTYYLTLKVLIKYSYNSTDLSYLPVYYNFGNYEYSKSGSNYIKYGIKDYLVFNTSDYIDTGEYATNNTTFELKFSNLSKQYNCGLFGGRSSNQTLWIFLDSASNLLVGVPTGSLTESRINTGYAYSETSTDIIDIVVSIDSNGVRTLYVNGESKGTFAKGTLNDATTTLLLGCARNNSGLLGYSKFRFNELKIWQNGTLKIDYVPYAKLNDVSTISGVYNLVDNSFKLLGDGSATAANY